MGHVGDIDVVAGMLTVTVNEGRAVARKKTTGLCDKLVWILPWSIDVVPPSDDDRHAERISISATNELRCSLRACIRVCGGEHGILLFKICLAAINFICAYVNETGDGSILAGGLQQDVSADDIVRSEGNGGVEGVVNVSTGGEIHDGIDIFGAEEVVHKTF